MLLARNHGLLSSTRVTLLPRLTLGKHILKFGVELGLRPLPVETNLVIVEVPLKGGPPALVAAARAEGVLTNSVSPTRVRFVTHLDFPAARVQEALARLRKAVGSIRG